MDVFPACSIVDLSDCPPGSAVKLSAYGDSGWGIVCRVVDQPDVRAVIGLSDDTSPTYDIYNQLKGHRVLAFDIIPRLEIDLSGPYEPPFRELYEANGAVIRNADGWFMNVRAGNGQRGHRGTLDIQTMTLVRDTERLNGVGIFGKWKLMMGSPDVAHQPPVELFSFAWKPRSNQR